ncbi:RING finger domain protein [Paramyrothecium foliicola]|nr:RING finger domain protein [Paramyrothecium foliicola]
MDMDPHSTRQAGTASPPSIPPEALEAINAPRGPDAPRRCFICLTDQEPSDNPSDWVDPCPCTLEAHQDCMLSWVTDCERSNKPLQCPVCKSVIHLEGPWDPVVALHDAVQRKFTRASPFALATSFSIGVQLSMQMYGAAALWAFSGRDVLLEFILGPNMILDGRAPRRFGLAGQNITNTLQLMSVGPALLIGQLLPSLGNKIFVPTASFYGIYHVLHDEQFLSWPPSPQLAMAVFPYIRSAYYNFWREFAFPYEVQLNRQLQGLPPLPPPQNGRAGNQRRDGGGNGEGGVMGFLQGLLDALDPDDEEHRGVAPAGAADQIRIVHEEVGGGENEDEDGEVLVELIIEEVVENEDDADDGPVVDDADMPQRLADEQPAQIAQPRPGQQRDEPLNVPAQQNPPQNHQHEAPQAPPARRPGLGSILSNISNAIVSALILPGISFAMGEALRLVLPKSWTTSPFHHSPWTRHLGRPGLLQQQWGRSLVGGCLYVVIKDVVRLYAKHRKVAAIENRRVKNASSHSSKQRLALAICDFLSASTTDGTLTADDKDSIDVAINCIAESFKVDPADKPAVQAAIGSQNLLQIYSVYEKLKNAGGAPGSAPAAGASNDSSAQQPSDAQKKEAEALKSKGNSAMAQKDYRAAIDLYTQALSIHPGNAVFLSNRAAAHSAAKDHASAKLDAESAVALDPSYTKAWSRLGLARFALGDAKGAMEAYGKGIEYEGNGGSDAMKKGFETAKRRVDEMEAEQESLPRSSPGGSAGGMPDLGGLASMLGGGGGGAGGMPDLSSIMSNPMFASMAQNLMSNPELMGNLMSNPRLREMANQFNSGGGLPDIGALMSDPNIADMARNMMGGGAPPGGPGAGGPPGGAGL